ncbi:hypothetical protein GGR53DRAFT_461963 [Hypoxylon sp. FL1150]|nr:hypothetical protein GGR53DRAFT_461963 [Hypoxylon sp. FL1150]
MATPGAVGGVLPTHRRFLTSLIDSLTSAPVAAAAAGASSASASAPTTTNKDINSSNAYSKRPDGNPLKLVPPACRPLFTTLYALYPLTLLPALDLLDRRLATRVFVGSPQRQQQQQQKETLETAQAETGGPTHDRARASGDCDSEAHGGNGNKLEGKVATGSHSYSYDSSADDNRSSHHRHHRRSNNHTRRSRGGRSSEDSYYVVRSAQPQQTRRSKAFTTAASPSSHSGPRYVVRLDAWNCTCAAFAFSAFPREVGHAYVIESVCSKSNKARTKERERERERRRREGMVGEEGLEEEKWEFGALSVDGREGSGIAGVPCCKHLLACSLAERWSNVLGGYVEERVVSREESAGLIADI